METSAAPHGHSTRAGALAWLERRLAGRAWAAGDYFTMADCAAAPSLFYAEWVHQIADTFPATSPVSLSCSAARLSHAPSKKGVHTEDTSR